MAHLLHHTASDDPEVPLTPLQQFAESLAFTITGVPLSKWERCQPKPTPTIHCTVPVRAHNMPRPRPRKRRRTRHGQAPQDTQSASPGSGVSARAGSNAGEEWGAISCYPTFEMTPEGEMVKTGDVIEALGSLAGTQAFFDANCVSDTDCAVPSPSVAAPTESPTASPAPPSCPPLDQPCASASPTPTAAAGPSPRTPTPPSSPTSRGSQGDKHTS